MTSAPARCGESELLRRRCTRDHLRSQRLRDVGRGQPDTTARTEHDHPLAGRDGRPSGERIQHGAVRRDQPGGLSGSEFAGNGHELVLAEQSVGLEAAGERRRQYPITDCEAGHALTDRGHPPRELAPRHPRERREQLVGAVHTQRVDEADAGGLDRDHRLSRARAPGSGCSSNTQVRVRTELVEDDAAHGQATSRGNRANSSSIRSASSRARGPSSQRRNARW